MKKNTSTLFFLLVFVFGNLSWAEEQNNQNCRIIVKEGFSIEICSSSSSSESKPEEAPSGFGDCYSYTDCMGIVILSNVPANYCYGSGESWKSNGWCYNL